MVLDSKWRIAVAGAIAAVTVALAIVSARHFIGGPATRYQQRAVSPEDLAQIDACTQELLALDAGQRAARLRELASPDATPQAMESLTVLLDILAEAEACTLARADGYGPKLIKAIFRAESGGDRAGLHAVMFERRGGSVVFLDVAH